jgi:RimJ/RimL family protein N-acetyltransferase
VHCVTSPKNTGSIAFHTRLGFEVEAEVEGYDGSGESRVLLAKTL